MSPLDVALAGLIATLSALLWRQGLELRQVRRDVRSWRNLAGLNARTASVNEYSARVWRSRALHPELASFWEVIEQSIRTPGAGPGADNEVKTK